ncbi:MAG TPA: hypothetical protein PKK43_06300 [Spirochaetota bacterium]|nr:hypothetical protein [Spirochaetota bacterium]
MISRCGKIIAAAAVITGVLFVAGCGKKGIPVPSGRVVEKLSASGTGFVYQYRDAGTGFHYISDGKEKYGPFDEIYSLDWTRDGKDPVFCVRTGGEIFFCIGKRRFGPYPSKYIMDWAWNGKDLQVVVTGEDRPNLFINNDKLFHNIMQHELSPDGTQLAGWVMKDHAIHVIINGELVGPFYGDMPSCSLIWSESRRTFVYAPYAPDEKEGHEVYIGTRRVKLAAAEKISYVGWSPDGKHLAYAANTGNDTFLFVDEKKSGPYDSGIKDISWYNDCDDPVCITEKDNQKFVLFRDVLSDPFDTFVDIPFLSADDGKLCYAAVKGEMVYVHIGRKVVGPYEKNYFRVFYPKKGGEMVVKFIRDDRRYISVGSRTYGPFDSEPDFAWYDDQRKAVINGIIGGKRYLLLEGNRIGPLNEYDPLIELTPDGKGIIYASREGGKWFVHEGTRTYGPFRELLRYNWWIGRDGNIFIMGSDDRGWHVFSGGKKPVSYPYVELIVSDNVPVFAFGKEGAEKQIWLSIDGKEFGPLPGAGSVGRLVASSADGKYFLLETGPGAAKQTCIAHDGRIDIGAMKDRMIVYCEDNRIVTVQ